MANLLNIFARYRDQQQAELEKQSLLDLGQQLGLTFPPNINSQLAYNLILNQQQASLSPQAQGFTLGQGQSRFDAQGNPIAAVAPQEVSPSQGISQAKLDRINLLQSKVEAGTATEQDKTILDKMLSGVPQVQINMGKTTGGERTALAETEASLDSLNNLQFLFDKTTTRTGPLAGRIDPTKGLFGLTTEDQEAFMAATSAFKNSVIKDITGAQMSEPEATRILKQIPDITDPPSRWKAKLEQTRRNLNVLQEKRNQILERSGIQSPLSQRPSPLGQSSLSEDLNRGASQFNLPGFRPRPQNKPNLGLTPAKQKELDAIDAELRALEALR